MFKFSRSKPAHQDSQFENTVMSTALNSGMAATEVGRELIRVAFKDTLRVTGVPANWIDCQVRTIPLGDGTERIQIHLVMKKWSGHLLRYMLAFEKQVVQCLDRYEPNVDHSSYEWLWRYSSDCENPFPTMPSPAEWALKADANMERKSVMQQQVMPRPSTAAAQSKKTKEFDLNDVFSTLTSDDLRSK
jgi:hypothetical protein